MEAASFVSIQTQLIETLSAAHYQLFSNPIRDRRPNPGENIGLVAFHQRTPFGDGFLGTVKIHQREVFQHWHQRHFRRIASHTRAGNAVLHDIDAGRHHIEKARILTVS